MDKTGYAPVAPDFQSGELLITQPVRLLTFKNLIKKGQDFGPDLFFLLFRRKLWFRTFHRIIMSLLPCWHKDTIRLWCGKHNIECLDHNIFLATSL
jgi:hypothetical protein